MKKKTNRFLTKLFIYKNVAVVNPLLCKRNHTAHETLFGFVAKKPTKKIYINRESQNNACYLKNKLTISPK